MSMQFKKLWKDRMVSTKEFYCEYSNKMSVDELEHDLFVPLVRRSTFSFLLKHINLDVNVDKTFTSSLFHQCRIVRRLKTKNDYLFDVMFNCLILEHENFPSVYILMLELFDDDMGEESSKGDVKFGYFLLKTSYLDEFLSDFYNTQYGNSELLDHYVYFL
jgi:hypothetical protein